MDVVVAAVALSAALPLIVLIGAVVWIRLGRPVLFRQARAGYHGRHFQIAKFRTMIGERPGVEVVTEADRVVPLGRFLRSTSLDELPELWNVLIGDMSLVGPRPLLVDYLPLYSPEQARRHDVRPGLTGWAQVNGRNSLGWAPRLALDTWYVDHVCPRLDVKIMWLTIWKILKREGVYAVQNAIMSRFKGEQE
jgi:lipopolysaccharide/colanic/teichoic acid biosynthesis glycosyltransferase